MYQGAAYKQSKVLRYWAKRHCVLLSNGRLFQAPGPLALTTTTSPRSRPRGRPGPTTVAASSAPGSRHRAGSTDSDDSDVMAAGPIMATLTGGGGGSDGGGRTASASCSCSKAVGAVPLPDSDYDPRVRFVVTADSFVGTVGEDETRPRLKLRCGRAADGERGASTLPKMVLLDDFLVGSGEGVVSRVSAVAVGHGWGPGYRAVLLPVG